MPRVKRARKSLSLRLQPYEGTPQALVADYLNGLEREEIVKLVGEVLVMCLLPIAQQNSGKFTQQQLRNSFLIARDMAEKHFGILALTLGLDNHVVAHIPSLLSPQITLNGNGGHASVSSVTEVEAAQEESAVEDSSLISGQASAAEIGNLFG
ncbi:hypothetical protein [Anabaena azotica]|uniref:hypothetical protein n=1 Tax=Anabaena azotica TaxID=197653 RepID=UPI0039A4B2E5